MSKHRLGRPSPALIVAMVALVAALAGTATALPGKNKVDKNDLAKNVVKSKSIKKNAVKSKHIKQNAVKAKQVADGTVGAAEIADGSVGSTEIGDGQVGAADLTDPEAFHVVGAPGEPAFGNGGDGDCLWSNPNPAILPDVNPASFFKDADGIVHLAGVPAASNGPGGDATCDSPGGPPPDISDLQIFQLPPGYQPEHLEIFPSGNTTVQLNLVAPAGGVTLQGALIPGGTVLALNVADGNATTLDGITFRAPGPATAASGTKAPPKVSLKALRGLIE